MNCSRRSALSLLSLPAFATGCAEIAYRYGGAYSRFRELPGEEWSYVIASTAVERPSSIRITASAYGGVMVGNRDHFILETNIAMMSGQTLDVDLHDLAVVVGIQPLPPGKYALDHIGFYANAWQSWSIDTSVAMRHLDVPARTVMYVGSYIATQSAAMRVSNEAVRDIPIAMSKNPKLRALPLVHAVPDR